MHVVIIVHKNSQLNKNGVKMMNAYGDMEVLKSLLKLIQKEIIS